MTPGVALEYVFFYRTPLDLIMHLTQDRYADTIKFWTLRGMIQSVLRPPYFH